MPKHILILQGHPDAGRDHLDDALAAAYAAGAADGGHALRQLEVTRLEFPLLRSRAEWEQGPPPPAIAEAQAAVSWADHLVIIYPLWLGGMPALLKGFLEQLLRPGFALPVGEAAPGSHKPLAGKSARIIVTMGMPAFFYRWYFRAHSLKSLERNILRFCGVRPVRASLIGMVEGASEEQRRHWLEQMRVLGRGAR